MRYIQRDQNGKLIGHYSHPHSYAMEEVPDDHPDILEWQRILIENKKKYMELKAQVSPEILLQTINDLKKQIEELKKK